MTDPERAGMTDEDVVRSVPRYQGPGEPRFVTDFLGAKTRVSYIEGLAPLDGTVEDYPVPGNFHANTIEWAGLLRAVSGVSGGLVVVELGAGWGPWLVSAARVARMNGVSDVRLVGVEGSDRHFGYLRSHFADNGLAPEQHTLLHGVVGPADGTAEFPALENPSHMWGAAAIYPSPRPLARRLVGYEGRRWARTTLRALVKGRAGGESPRTERVRCYSLPTLLRPFAEVDLVHVDIQGEEYTVIASARQVLRAKVNWLVVGTHDRLIEQRLMTELAGQGWVLESEESCRFRQDDRRMVLSLDGCQVWRNAARVSGPAGAS